jgi:hypothetical protein
VEYRWVSEKKKEKKGPFRQVCMILIFTYIVPKVLEPFLLEMDHREILPN